MGKCYHTGLPQNMCGHCNGTDPIVRDGVRRRHEEKLGQSIKATPDVSMKLALIENSPYVHEVKSEWGRMNAFRSLSDLVKKVGILDVKMIASIPAPVRVVTPQSWKIEKNIDGQKSENLPKAWATPKRVMRDGLSVQTIKHARSAGRAGRVLAARHRT